MLAVSEALGVRQADLDDIAGGLMRVDRGFFDAMTDLESRRSIHEGEGGHSPLSVSMKRGLSRLRLPFLTWFKG